MKLQDSLRAALTVFSIEAKNDFFKVIGIFREDEVFQINYREASLSRLLNLDPSEFEILTTALLRTLGFEVLHTGKTGDQGVDAEGELNIYNLAKIKLYVQMKRYKPGNNINAATVRALRQNIHQGAQGAFITTSDFQRNALEVANEPGFPRIGTINGTQLIDLLSLKWEEIELSIEQSDDDSLKKIVQKLGLKRGLVWDE